MTEPKTEEIKTPSQDGSPEDKKDQTPVVEPTQKTPEPEEQVTISNKELATLQNKAKDFDGIIEKQRLEKLSKKPDNKPEPTGDDVIEEARKAGRDAATEIIQKNQSALYESNLAVAYKQFVSDNKWADNDEIIASISKNFSSGGLVSQDDLLVRLNIAAQNTFPKEFQKSLEDKATAKVLAQQSNIDAGDGGTASSQFSQTVIKEQPTAYDQKQADKFFGGDIERYMKHKPKE